LRHHKVHEKKLQKEKEMHNAQVSQVMSRGSGFFENRNFSSSILDVRNQTSNISLSQFSSPQMISSTVNSSSSSRNNNSSSNVYLPQPPQQVQQQQQQHLLQAPPGFSENTVAQPRNYESGSNKRDSNNEIKDLLDEVDKLTKNE